jgi:hypothetical protein
MTVIGKKATDNALCIVNSARIFAQSAPASALFTLSQSYAFPSRLVFLNAQFAWEQPPMVFVTSLHELCEGRQYVPDDEWHKEENQRRRWGGVTAIEVTCQECVQQICPRVLAEQDDPGTKQHGTGHISREDVKEDLWDELTEFHHSSFSYTRRPALAAA